MIEKAFLPPSYARLQDEGSVLWTAPSNIALVKYWGKKKLQIPANPSLSFTLEGCVTTTRLSFRRKGQQGRGFSFDILLNRLPNEAFRPKIEAFFKRAAPYLPFLREFHFTIETTNSFPHSSGIASSASGMAALALCLTALERQWRPEMEAREFNRKASFLARLGSGSACRSIQGPIMEWGRHEGIPESSDLHAILYPFKIHKVFNRYQDTILLVDKGQKQVSSTEGHELMHGHPYASARFAQAHSNLTELKTIFAKGDLEGFIRIVELEALTLHAMMMTSYPYFILMKPNTLEIIQRVREIRNNTKLPFCFTLDAGANVHLLYPEEIKHSVLGYIKQELMVFCENGQYICDQIGNGAKNM